jgi:hypothetical protein
VECLSSTTASGLSQVQRPGIARNLPALLPNPSAVRRTLYIKFKIRETDVFEKPFGYVRERTDARTAVPSSVVSG